MHSEQVINSITMKKGNLLFLIGLIILGCSKEDDTGLECPDDCTLIEGQFVTKSNTPLKNIKVRLDYEETGSGFFSNNERKIQSIRSNENGLYSLKFYLKELELNNPRGWFSLNIDASNLNRSNYILPDQFSLGYSIFSISRRDTLITKSFYIPTKTYITVNLNGFEAESEDDFFEVRTLFPGGLKVGEDESSNNIYQRSMSGYGAFQANSTNNTFNDVYAAADEVNTIRIVRRKNGETEHEDLEIFIPNNNTINLTFEY